MAERDEPTRTFRRGDRARVRFMDAIQSQKATGNNAWGSGEKTRFDQRARTLDLEVVDRKAGKIIAISRDLGLQLTFDEAELGPVEDSDA